MCGRYESAINHDELDEIFGRYIGKLHIDYDIDEVLIGENIAPTDRVRTVIQEDGIYKVRVMKWGIRSKVFDPKRKAAGKEFMVDKDIFNSKIETIKTSKNWKETFEINRCIFPMTAFYEWPVIDGKKVPQRISITTEKCFFAGGIFKKGPDGEAAASIITCEPNIFMKHIHNRMPLLFSAEEAKAFLGLPAEDAASVCIPLCDNIKMEMKTAEILIKK
ncbi:MAG: SOS response-associated peptidase [Bacteroidota bacterium]|nr:SOS response-associated peptidase [Bacteroidota bacterium]